MVLCAGVVGVLILAGCDDSLLGDGVEGSGDAAVDVRPLDGFEQLVLAGEGQVLLGHHVDGEIEIETDANLFAHIETEIAGETLTIRTERGVDIEPTAGVTYRLGCPELSAVTLSGAGTIDLDRCTASSELELVLSGAGSIIGPELELDHLRVSLPGAGDIVVDGRADRLDVSLSGAGALEAADLRVSAADVASSGAGAVTLWVDDTLDVRVSGVGVVRYHGEPNVDATIDGLGSVEPLGPQ